MPDFALVLAPGQDGAALELSLALRDELTALGQRAEISRGFPEPHETLVQVLTAPLAYYRTEGIAVEPAWQLLKRSAFVCVEPPGSPAFEEEAFLAQRAGAVFHTSRRATAQLAQRGLAGARPLPVGWSEHWATQPASERDIDVLVQAPFTHKRGRDVAANAPWLWDRRAPVYLDGDSDVPDPQLLARAKVVLNLHAGANAYLEWLPVVRAIGAGCAVVSEHSLDYAPLRAGEDIVFGRADNLALMARELLDDEIRRDTLARSARARLEAEQPLRRGAVALIDAAAVLAAQPLPPPGRTARFRKPLVALETVPLEPYPSVVSDPEASALRAALKETRLDLLQLRRNVAALALRQVGGDPDRVEDAARSASYDSASPRISVVTALYNHAEHIAEALDSAAASTIGDVELVITNDGSSDESAAVVRDWITRSPDVPARLLQHPVNRGLGAARNTAVEHARGELVLFLDADNVLYPPAIEKLVTALDAEPDAVLGYGILEMFGPAGPVGLRSWQDWRPERFRSGNFVDALALVRRDWLVAIGGFVTDPRLHGWEDYDLWCRAADDERRGVFVPEIVARYRSSPHSMLSLTDLSTRQAVALLAERHPSLFAGVQLPL